MSVTQAYTSASALTDDVGKPAAETPGRAPWGVVALAVCAYFCMKLRANLLNGPLFGLITAVYPYSRDLLTLASGACGLVIFALAFYRPSVFARRGIDVAAVVCAAAGLVLLVADSASFGLGWLAVLGSALFGAGSSWLYALGLLGCCRMDLLQITVGIPLAMAAAKVASQLCKALVNATAASPRVIVAAGSQACGATSAQLFVAVLTILCVLGIFLCVSRVSRPVLEGIAAGPVPAHVSLANPASFLPLTSTLFVSLFLLKLINGFELRFDVSSSTASFLITLAMIVIAAVVGARDVREGRYALYDRIFSTAVLFAILAFLVVPLDRWQFLASDFLAVSSPCINLLLDLVLISAARNNLYAAMGVIGFGDALGSFGTTLGANVGALAGSAAASEQTYLVCAVMAGILLAYVLFAMRDFSFGATILNIKPMPELVVSPEASSPDASHYLEKACADLAAGCALSPREADVLELLARGRNNAFIQEELCLTRNTVKSHIRHIYTKLNVHSQQELIDLVDENVARLR